MTDHAKRIEELESAIRKVLDYLECKDPLIGPGYWRRCNECGDCKLIKELEALDKKS